MRKISFRAWDKKDKIMREIYGIQFPKISNHGNRENTIIEMHCSDYEGQKAIILSDFTRNIKDIELLQFTGLTDKNGVEIFEGDVVKNTPLNIDFHTKPVEVKWDKHFAGWLFGGNSAPHYYDADDIEVIGNIYSNPELIK